MGSFWPQKRLHKIEREKFSWSNAPKISSIGQIFAKIQYIEIWALSSWFELRLLVKSDPRFCTFLAGDLVENYGLLRLHRNRSESIFSDECTGRSVRSFFTNLWEKTRYINLGQVLKKILLILLEILTKVSKFPSTLSSRLLGRRIFPDRHFVRKIFLFREQFSGSGCNNFPVSVAM